MQADFHAVHRFGGSSGLRSCPAGSVRVLRGSGNHFLIGYLRRKDNFPLQLHLSCRIGADTHRHSNGKIGDMCLIDIHDHLHIFQIVQHDGVRPGETLSRCDFDTGDRSVHARPDDAALQHLQIAANFLLRVDLGELAGDPLPCDAVPRRLFRLENTAVSLDRGTAQILQAVHAGLNELQGGLRRLAVRFCLQIG